eukprot:SAG11_NODE_19104_length_474_cov_0.813333_1_plen_97_part_10
MHEALNPNLSAPTFVGVAMVAAGEKPSMSENESDALTVSIDADMVGRAVAIKDFPPMPRRDHKTMCSESCLGMCVVFFIIGAVLGVTHAITLSIADL